MLHRIVNLLFVLFVTTLLEPVATARTLRVPQEWPSIQAALDTLSAYDTVLVSAGIYAEALIAPPLPFALRGEAASDTSQRVIIDPSTLPDRQSCACLILPPSSVTTLENIRFRNGPQMYPRLNGDLYGGVRFSGDSITIRHCLFDSTYGGLVATSGRVGSIRLQDCQFRNDSLFCVYGAQYRVRADNCSFSGQSIYALVNFRSHSHFESCIVHGNTRGSLLDADGTEIELVDCVFADYGPFGLSPVYASLDRSRISHCVFTRCRGAPATLRLEVQNENTVLVDSCVFLQNNLPTGEGSGGVLLQFDDGRTALAARLQYCTFAECNSLPQTPRALRLQAGAIVERNRFTDMVRDMPEPAILLNAGQALLLENHFQGTMIAAAGTSLLDARWNWWGDPSGPYHATRNPDGRGDEVQGDLQFDPWYTDSSMSTIRGIHLPLPQSFEFSAYPNPFNATVTLKLVPDEIQIVRVELFDLLGRRIEEIWSGPVAYEKEIHFDASALPSGIYFARVTNTIERRMLATTKLVLMK